MFAEGFRTTQGCYLFDIPDSITDGDVLFIASRIDRVLTPGDYTLKRVPNGLELRLTTQLPTGGGLVTLYGYYPSAITAPSTAKKAKAGRAT